MKRLAPAILLLFLLMLACKPDPKVEPVDEGDLSNIEYQPVSYEFDLPKGYQQIDQPEDNQATEAGVQLGRFLFFDPILSADGTMSCSSCHEPVAAFTDNQAVSKGIDGVAGVRSSMSLVDLAYNNRGLFWDGRIKTLEEQALLPVEDPIELHDDWGNVVNKLKAHPDYPSRFRKAFGIDHVREITKELAVKAIAQYERALISPGNSKYDRVVQRREEFFEDEELNGYDMFFDISPELPDAECGHCHNGPYMTTHEFFNNGLQNVNSLDDFPDKGLGAFTGVRQDNGKFRAPTLRNIELTAPYMHDGRFETLE
ncbi:MAG: cytochrome c peroxidase, partial [Bacteroidota bacterium]